MDKKNQQIAEYYSDQKTLIDALTYLANFGSYVFRGYNKQDQLLPIIIREKDFSNVEAELLSEFEKYGSHYFIASTPIDFLSYGQHYGLPTRLLDFTYNPFIALSFALFSQKSPGKYKETEDKDYYYIRYCNIKDHIHLKGIPAYHPFESTSFESDSMADKCRDVLKKYGQIFANVKNNFIEYEEYLLGLFQCDYQAGNDTEKYMKTTKQKIESKKLCFIDPNQSNQRIIMQQGLFMLPYTLSADEHQEIIFKNTSVLKIHRDLRGSLLKYLDTLGYNTFRLMPDLSSICAAVTQKVKDARAEQSMLFKIAKPTDD